MRETKFKIGQRPWVLEMTYYRGCNSVYRVYQHSKEVAEVAISLTKDKQEETPYFENGYGISEPYGEFVFPTKEEAVEKVREVYKKAIAYAKEDIAFFEKELEELE